MAGISHMTAYNWRKRYPEFAERWAEAVDMATDCVESVVAHAALSGNLTAAFFWRKHHRPRVYNREALAKLAMLHSAIQSQAAKGGGRLTIQIDANGIPHIAEGMEERRVALSPTTAEPLQSRNQSHPSPQAQEPQRNRSLQRKSHSCKSQRSRRHRSRG